MKGCARKLFSYCIFFTCIGSLSNSQAATFLGTANAGGTALVNVGFHSDNTFNAGSDVSGVQLGTAITTLYLSGRMVFDSSALNVTLSNPLSGVISSGSAFSNQPSAFTNASIKMGLLYTHNVNSTASGLAGDVITVGVPVIPVPTAAILLAIGFIGLFGVARRKPAAHNLAV